MKNKIIMGITAVLSTLTAMNISAATSAELVKKEKAVYAILENFWADKMGILRVGKQNPLEFEFAFNESLMDLMTVNQLIDTMHAALAPFDKAKQAVFENAVAPYLAQLDTIKKEKQLNKGSLDTIAQKLGALLGKNTKDVLKMPEQNIRALITKLPQAKKIQAGQLTADFFKMRKEIDVEPTENMRVTVNEDNEEMKTEDRKDKKDKTKLSATQRAARAVAESTFDAGSIVAFTGEAIKKSFCANRHFDMIRGLKGITVLSIAQ